MTPEREKLVAAKKAAEKAHVFRKDYTDFDLWQSTLREFQNASARLAAYDAQQRGT